MKKDYVIFVCNLLGIESSRTFLVFLAILLAFIYIFKNIYLMIEFNIQYRFVYGNMFSLQERLLDSFLHRPYEYFLNISSAEIIRIVSSDTRDAFNLLTTMLSLFTETVVSAMLIITIFVIAPFVTVCIAVLLILLMIFIYVVIKPVLRRAGLNQQSAGAGMNKWLLQTVQGIKELKVMQKEEFFKKNFGENGRSFIRSLRISQILSIAPRFIIEGVCMSAVFISVAIMLYQHIDLESIIPILTAVAMAGIRLLPSVNRISSALSQIAYGEPMLDKVIENIRVMDDVHVSCQEVEVGKPSEQVSELSDEMRFHNVSYHYPNTEMNVLESACMVIKKADSIGIEGPSGAGKTTCVDIVLGLLTPQKGQILIDGVDISRDIPGWLNQIGYIPQMIFMLDDTIRANVAFGEDQIDDERVWNALIEASLDEFVKGLPDALDTEIGERGMRLSGGQRQRIGIARALYKNPQVLIFDEATSALDNDTESAIMDSIYRMHGNKTMIIIAHRLTTIEACDHIYRVESGKISLQR